MSELTLSDFVLFVESDEYDSLDELDKSTLKSYIKKAMDDHGDKNFKYGMASDKLHAEFPSRVADKIRKNAKKRQKGVALAVDKLTKENFGSLFEGEELSDEFKEKATLVFEAAVSEKAKERVEEISTELQEKFDSELGKIHEELVEKIDSALNYFVEGWMEENKIAIGTGIRTEIVENFITKLKDLFVESYIEVPEEKVEYVSEMEHKIISMEEKLNEQIQKNIDLNAKIGNMVKESIFTDVSKGLADSESEKLKGLVESVEFVSESDYKEKLETLRENYFPKVGTKTEPDGIIDESIQDKNKKVEPIILKEAEYIQTKYANI